MAEPRQVIGAGKTGGTGANDKDATPGQLTAARLPFLLPSEVAQKALDGVDAHGGVEVSSVTPALAGMITGPTVHGWKRIVVEDLIPRLPPSAGPRMLKPGLNVLSSRTSRIAGWQVGDPVRELPPCRSRARSYRRNAGSIGMLQHRGNPPADRAKTLRRMKRCPNIAAYDRAGKKKSRKSALRAIVGSLASIFPTVSARP